jgi:hypothetical protein
LPTLSAESRGGRDEVDTVLDPERLAGLPESCFWTESFVIGRTSWAKEHAEEVYRAKESTGLSFNQLVERFGKTRPTIKHAYDIAAARRQQNASDAQGAPSDGEAS